jgi:hypothetical protein
MKAVRRRSFLPSGGCGSNRVAVTVGHKLTVQTVHRQLERILSWTDVQGVGRSEIAMLYWSVFGRSEIPLEPSRNASEEYLKN